MESLKNISGSLRLPPKVKEGLWLYKFLKENWIQIMEAEAKDTTPLYFEEGVLVIGVSDHYTLQKISSQYLTILERLRNLYPHREAFPIKTLKFVFHPLRKTPKEASRFKQLLLSQETLEELKLHCRNLSDPELQEAFLKLFQRLSLRKP